MKKIKRNWTWTYIVYVVVAVVVFFVLIVQYAACVDNLRKKNEK